MKKNDKEKYAPKSMYLDTIKNPVYVVPPLLRKVNLRICKCLDKLSGRHLGCCTKEDKTASS
eukprot:snap_masked-scaffold_25-processed-gene-5.4-mRNA-1 protein AED:1.00 eAED:1.00 QI:0/0/0/0/1/1/2/0/61